MLSIPHRGRRGSGRMVVAPGFVNYKKGCTRLAAASDKGYQLLAHGRWFSPGTSASSTTKTGRHDIAEILMKVALNTKNQSINRMVVGITTTCAISVYHYWCCEFEARSLCDKVCQWHATGRWFSPGSSGFLHQ